MPQPLMLEFAGSLQPTGLAQAAGASGSDELAVDFRRDPRGALKGLPAVAFDLSQDELDAVATSVKFSAAIPDVLLRRLAAVRLFDATVLGNESNRLWSAV